MQLRASQTRQAVLLILGLAATLALPCPARAVQEHAQSADAFVDSICVNTHWSYRGTPYGFAYDAVKQALVDSGIRHYRDGFNTRMQDLAALGLYATVIADLPNNTDGDPTTIQQIVGRIKASNTPLVSIDAVEGPNEADLFWGRFHKTYLGQGFPGGLVAFQRDLYAALKADPDAAAFPVIGPSLGRAYDYGRNPLPPGSLTDYLEYGNFHSYPGGNPFSNPNFNYDTIAAYYWHSNFPSVNLDRWPYGFDVYGPPFRPKPMTATETGYSTNTNDLSETVHAKYMPRLFLEYFRLGIVRTCSYEFVDEWNNPPDREANFGLLHHDLTPKPAYTAVQNLISILQEPGASFTPDSLDYTLAISPVDDYTHTDFVHHLLLEKSTGDFYLVLWHEISNDDITHGPPREINPPDMPATITLHTPIAGATLYSLADDGAAVSQTVDIVDNTLSLSVPDKVIILQLTPASGAFLAAGR